MTTRGILWTLHKIEEFLKTATPVKEIAANIVQKAISNYSDDNCTAVVLKIKE